MKVCLSACTSSARDVSMNVEDNEITTFDNVVQIMASYDMGWSTRGTGRDYDSLNGFGSIVGVFSKQILDYSTCNRKCKKCDKGRTPFDHDCRLNFWGSAKAMEAHVANKIVNESSILKSKNIQVGILVGDDDSSTIASCRAGASHAIGKLSDVNHTSKNVKKELYNIEKNYKELKRDGINYLHRCFTYAMAQNKGNSAAMAQNIRSIPYHVFNNHEKCGQWCGFIKDPENYDHKIVPGGFHDINLLETLKAVFERLAINADKFSVGVSTNINESLNASMASKAPKSKSLSTTAAADYRYACVVAQKNIGESYMQKVSTSLELSPGKHHTRFISRIEHLKKRRAVVIASRAFKQRRLDLKKYRTSLRHQKENAEGTTYKSNCALNEPAVQEPMVLSDDEGTLNEISPIIFLDIETTGLNRDCDIIQIAAKCGASSFSVYINPKKEISVSASAVHGIRKLQGDLMLHGKKIDAVPLRVAIGQLLQWFQSFKKKCYVATHNLNFDGPRLIDAILLCCLNNEFSDVITGFVDTLKVIRTKTERKGKGECTVTGLASWLNISAANAHNAVQDVAILEKIIKRLQITYDVLLQAATCYSELCTKWISDKQVSLFLPCLTPLANTVGIEIRKKLARSSISIDHLKKIYDEAGSEEIYNLLSKKIDNKYVVTGHKPTIEKIIAFLKNLK